jgi:hypothetical protein
MFLWDAMYTNPKRFQDVREFKKNPTDSSNPRIYEAGSKLPDLRYNPQSTLGGNLFTSGIYQLPLQIDDWRNRHISKGQLNESDVNYIWSGHANETLRADIFRKFGPNPLWQKEINNEDLFSFTIPQVLEMNGPGVYYFMNCRYMKGLKVKLHTLVDAYLKEVDPLLAKYKNIFNRNQYDAINEKRIRNEIKRIKNIPYNFTSPEKKLPNIREQLSKVSTYNESNFANQTAKIIELEENEDRKEDLFSYLFALLQRKYLEKFDQEFGYYLGPQLLATRALSNEAQARFTGGKKRKTKKMKNSRKRYTRKG